VERPIAERSKRGDVHTDYFGGAVAPAPDFNSTMTQKAQSHIVREAIAAYARQEEQLTEAERARKLDVLDGLSARPRTRPQAAVDAELRDIRRARRAGWRRPSDCC
jgi:hypothetical protein